MRTIRFLGLGLLFLVSAVLLCSVDAAWAQEVTAAITGTVTDPSGAGVAGATVTAKSLAQGVSFTATTNELGIYRISNLPVGNYDLRVEKQGFQTALRPAFTLVLNQTARIDVEMKVGQVNQTIEVSSDAPLLKTETTQVDTIINAVTNEAIPLATRNYVQLTLLAPGSVTPNPSSFNNGDNTASGGRPYINGNREQSNNFLLDGMDNNQVSDNLLGYTPAPDAIEEFNLITNNASAEFGNFEGGIVSVTIKSGTNNFHGNAWEFFRNDVLNANKWENNFARIPKDKLRWNMFGATLGGPAIKNKLFFFVDYQGQRFDHPSSTGPISVFTNAERTGDFSQLLAEKGIQLYNPCASFTQPCTPSSTPAAVRQPFPNNQIPIAMIDPVAQALFASSLYPSTVNNNLQQNALNTTRSQLNSNQGDIKVDYQLSNKDRISVRFTRAYQNNPTSNSQPLLANGSSAAPIWNTVGDWTRMISPNLVNSVRFGWSHITLNTGSSFDSSVGALGNTLGIGNGNPSGIDGLPSLEAGNLLRNLGDRLNAQSFDDHVWQLEDSLSYTRGRHTFKFGFQYWKEPIKTFYSGNNGQLGFLTFNGSFTASAVTKPATNSGNGVADFFLGLPSEFGRGLSNGRTWEQSTNVYAGYAQDTWRLTDRLTVNVGVRYEAHTPWVETNDQQANYDLKTQQIVFAGQNGTSRSLYDGVYGGKAFQPRIGFAWTPAMLGGHTVVRGAFTVSSYLEGTGTNLRLPINPPFNPAELDVPYTNVALPATSSSDGIVGSAGSASCDPPAYACYAGALLRVWDNNVQPALSDQWNLTVQHQFWGNTTVQLGYVGQRGTHLMVPFSYSQRQLLTPSASCAAPCTAPSPFFANNPDLVNSISKFTSGTQSNGTMGYNALQAVLQKQMSKGLQYQVAYTYSKCMTDNSGYYGSWGAQAAPASPYWQNIYNPKAEWAPCYYDSTNVLSTYAIYEIPVGRGKAYAKDMNKVVDAIVGGWTISPILSVHSGFPMAPYGTDRSGTNSRSARPNCDSIAHVQGRVPGSNFGGIQWFTNNGNFSDTVIGTFGSCPAQLGWLHGPGYSDLDLSLQKNFQITEHYKLQFRSDFINAFNQVNLNVPDMGLGATMGQITSSQASRNIQFALKFYY